MSDEIFLSEDSRNRCGQSKLPAAMMIRYPSDHEISARKLLELGYHDGIELEHPANFALPQQKW